MSEIGAWMGSSREDGSCQACQRGITADGTTEVYRVRLLRLGIAVVRLCERCSGLAASALGAPFPRTPTDSNPLENP